MDTPDWLMMRALTLVTTHCENAAMLLLELSRYSDGLATATRIWDTVNALSDDAKALKKTLEELQSGIICRAPCPRRAAYSSSERLITELPFISAHR